MTTASTPDFISPDPVDLNNCDRELVQYMGAIQPHGALLVLNAANLQVIQASENSLELLGQHWETLIGVSIDNLLGVALGASLREAIQANPIKEAMVNILNIDHLPGQTVAFHLFANQVDDLILLEFEPRNTLAGQLSIDVLWELRNAFTSLQKSTSLQDFLQEATNKIRHMSGFERVMAYQFADDGSGEVVAESKLDELEGYLGLHYPASDIPAPARRLFAMSPLRHLPDVDYLPVPLLPAIDRLVDLSCAHLRSVSTMYSVYLRNMGTKATLVMPLLIEGRLWGLISCMHHSASHYLYYEQRIPLEFVSCMLSQLLAGRQALDQQAYRLRLEIVLEHLLGAMQSSQSLPNALISGEWHLLSEINAAGVALCMDDKCEVKGNTPTTKDIHSLIDWLETQNKDVFATQTLGQLCPAFSTLKAVASGVLAIRLSQGCPDWIIWFRPEVIEEIQWAGDPHKPVEVDQVNGLAVLRPRASFATWKQQVIGQSTPWLSCELEYVARIRYAIFGYIVERAWLLAQMNAELERSNLELDGFAYAASHDMKEPLRGIHNLVEFLKFEEAERLTQRGQLRLDTILQLTQRMDNLLAALLEYSRIGKNKLELAPYNTFEIITQVVQLVKDAYSEFSIDIQLESSFPTLVCDGLWVARIFQNLITNAIKYNQQTLKTVAIGCDTTANPPLFYIRDNGIGIDLHNQQGIFELFNRLYDRKQFGEGSGVGLAIAKRVVERHGGRIWLTSAVGLGSTFFFTLSPAKPD